MNSYVDFEVVVVSVSRPGSSESVCSGPAGFTSRSSLILRRADAAWPGQVCLARLLNSTASARPAATSTKPAAVTHAKRYEN